MAKVEEFKPVLKKLGITVPEEHLGLDLVIDFGQDVFERLILKNDRTPNNDRTAIDPQTNETYVIGSSGGARRGCYFPPITHRFGNRAES